MWISTSVREAKRIATRRFLRTGAAPSIAARTHGEQVSVVGVGVGTTADSSPTIRLYLEKTTETRDQAGTFPREIQGVRTEVVVSGKFTAAMPPLLQGLQGMLSRLLSLRSVRGHLRPARPGCSIGFHRNRRPIAGTFGAVVEREGRRYLLSNNHVLVPDNASPPDPLPILQPGGGDGGRPPTHQLGVLADWHPLNPNGPNLMDAALAAPLDPVHLFPAFLPPVNKLADNRVVAASQDMRVHKVGRGSGYTKGLIYDLSADLEIDYPFPLGRLRFEDQLLVKCLGNGPFASPGDSGSVLVDEATNRAMGLLFACAPTFGVATPLESVLQRFNVSLVC